jgi:xanthine dehydrogenase YagR molybdenum-binding subunit
LFPDARVAVQTSSQEIGTGIRTVAAQMAAERLGLEISAIEVEMGDSALPPAPVSGGSISTASVCSTVMKGCDAIRRRVFQAASSDRGGPFAGRNADDLDLKSGAVVAPDGTSVPLRDVLGRNGFGVIEEYAEWAPEGTPPDGIQKLYRGQNAFKSGSGGDKLSFAFGAEFVEVRINTYTREIRVPRIVGAFAAGRIMNPRTARSQLMGGLIWGIGSALHEATEIDPRAARIVNRDLADYLVAVNADVGDVEVILVPEEDSEVNPAGIKGLGELGNVGTNAAVANAVYHATGHRIRDLPIRLEKLIA